jgi:hypothetical protein
MGKISERTRSLYFEKIKPYRGNISAILKKEKETLALIRMDPDQASFKNIELAEEMLNLASHYIMLSRMSQSILKVKNEDALHDGRKTLYKSLIYLENAVTNLVDAPYSEFEERIALIADMNAAERLRLIRKMGLALDFLKDAYGDNTKWRWAFVELEGRFATVAKNILDWKKAPTNTDPASPDYEPTMRHLQLVKKLFSQAADRYREMYELSTGRVEDYKMGIYFLEGLRRIHIMLWEREEAELIKKKLGSWSAKLNSDTRLNADRKKG